MKGLSIDMRRLAVRAMLGSTAAAALLAAPATGLPSVTAFAAPDQKTSVTYDCASAGIVQLAVLYQANGSAAPILNSDRYHTFVSHEAWVYDANNNLVLHSVRGTEGSVPGLQTCTSYQNGYTIVIEASLR